MAVGKILYSAGKITHLPRVGADWNMNDKTSDEKFNDLPHMEIYKP
jgi:hypothetical protein